MGVAKKRFKISCCLRLKKGKCHSKYSGAYKEKPNCPGKIKSMRLYSLPGIFSM
jgi:hypothetical protein